MIITVTSGKTIKNEVDSTCNLEKCMALVNV